MRKRLGVATSIIDNDMFLPMFRSRQINHEEIFNYSVELAKTKNNPSKYFASIWGRRNLEKTVKWLTRTVNLIKSRASEAARNAKRSLNDAIANKEIVRNTAKLDKLKALKRKHFNLRP